MFTCVVVVIQSLKMIRLTFRELQPLSGAWLTVLLALNLPGIPGQEASLFEGQAEVLVDLFQGPGYCQAYGTSLAGKTPSVYMDFDVILAYHPNGLQRLHQELFIEPAVEIVIEFAFVNYNFALAAFQLHPGDRRLPSPNSPRIDFSHKLPTYPVVVVVEPGEDDRDQRILSGV